MSGITFHFTKKTFAMREITFAGDTRPGVDFLIIKLNDSHPSPRFFAAFCGEKVEHG